MHARDAGAHTVRAILEGRVARRMLAIECMSTITSVFPAHRIGATTIQRSLLVCGIMSSLVYVAANVAAGISWHGYSFSSQAISELSAIGAPSRSVWLPFGIAYDVLLVAFAIGVWRSAGQRRLRVVSAALIAIGAIGLVWPPMHMRGSPTSLTDTLHVVWASVTSLLILVAIAFGATAFGKRFLAYSLATIAGLLVFGTLSFHEAPKLAVHLPTPSLGTFERLNLAVYLVWVAVLAIVLLRAERHTSWRDRCRS